MAGAGISIAGIIAVLVIMIRPNKETNATEKRPIQQAQQTITQQEETQKNTQDKDKNETPSLFSGISHHNSLTKIEEYITTAGLNDQLSGKGPFTFFLPNNDAFTQLSTEEQEQMKNPDNTNALADLITYHIVPGKLKLEDFSDGEHIKTLEGELIQIEVKDKTYTINNAATVTEQNIEVPNGMVHIIDTVLVPDESDEE